jgi:hypothetical protein
MAAVSDQTGLGGCWFCCFRFHGALGGFASSFLAFFVFWRSDYCETTKIQADPLPKCLINAVTGIKWFSDTFLGISRRDYKRSQMDFFP